MRSEWMNCEFSKWKANQLECFSMLNIATRAFLHFPINSITSSPHTPIFFSFSSLKSIKYNFFIIRRKRERRDVWNLSSSLLCAEKKNWWKLVLLLISFLRSNQQLLMLCADKRERRCIVSQTIMTWCSVSWSSGVMKIKWELMRQ